MFCVILQFFFFLISVDVTWHSFYTILVQFSSCSSGIPEISSISLLPCCSSWFLLTFSSSNSSWSSFSVLLMRVFFVFRFLFSASILAIWLPWVSSISAWKSCDFSMSISILWLFYFFLLHAFYPGRKVVFFLLYYVQLFYLFLDTFNWWCHPSKGSHDIIQDQLLLLCCTLASWLFRFILLLWFCGSNILLIK